MGYLDYGGGPAAPCRAHPRRHGGHSGRRSAVSVADLTATRTRKADVVVDLDRPQGPRSRSPSGSEVDGYTLNGTLPRPARSRSRQGQLVEVHLRNESVPDGITLHWHGVDVPNAEDGVAGVTQDAVEPGEELHLPLRRRRTPAPTGTTPTRSRTSRSSAACSVRSSSGPSEPRPAASRTSSRCSHTLRRHPRPSTAHEATCRSTAEPGPAGPGPGGQHRQRAAARLGGRALPGASPSTGTTSTSPTAVDGQAVAVTAGGRVDLEVTVPADGTAVRVAGRRATARRDRPAAAPTPPPVAQPDERARPARLRHARRRSASTRRTPTGTFDYSIGRRPGFVEGQAGAVVDDQRPPLTRTCRCSGRARATSSG